LVTAGVSVPKLGTWIGHGSDKMVSRYFHWNRSYKAIEIAPHVMTNGELPERTWGRALVHESGHALMAVLQGITCHGICFETNSGTFCTVTPFRSPGELSKKDYLFFAASTAAELLLCRFPDAEAAGTSWIQLGAATDSNYFQTPGAPSREETVGEAVTILLGRIKQLQRLASLLRNKVRERDCDLSRLPLLGKEASGKKFVVLLSKKELEDALPRNGL
jgi:hypothetical protein